MEAARRPLVGAALAFLLPGGGHLYARLVPAAVVLEIGMVACFVTLVIRPADFFPRHAAFATLVAIVICDAVGAFRAVRARNHGADPAGRGGPIGRGLALLAIAAVVGVAVASAVAIPGWLAARRLAPFSVWCGEDVIGVRNGAAGATSVSIDRVRVLASASGEWRRYDLGVTSGATQRLDAGASGDVVIGILPALTARCASWESNESGSDRCVITFEIEFSGAQGEPRDPPVRAVGVCRPPWGRATERRAGRLFPLDAD